jgi:hypothetical protein
MAIAINEESVVCAFCQGKGTDPYDQLSSLSVCGSCNGTGRKFVSTPHTPCTFCQGTGSFKTFRCLICGGAGVVHVMDGPTETCPDCEGTAVESSSGLPCVRCRGRGLIHVAVEHEEEKEEAPMPSAKHIAVPEPVARRLESVVAVADNPLPPEPSAQRLEITIPSAARTDGKHRRKGHR